MEYIEIDVDAMEMGKLYLVKYNGDTLAARKIGDEQIVFYDVID